ncbi:Membrane-associated phosphatidylinositol transfer protein 1 [Camelus dromedarius]|uniref:Membrane-associated phosphatidylinositol transfer protein 1 n=1 Tax=Camelus dromedarius TaxID=9838 RepID=A0A5N4BYN6_CAMDR|nr:Membrane-associated phosphatidylinositol transfer protein 1 [Camelus dromedarius]
MDKLSMADIRALEDETARMLAQRMPKCNTGNLELSHPKTLGMGPEHPGTQNYQHRHFQHRASDTVVCEGRPQVLNCRRFITGPWTWSHSPEENQDTVAWLRVDRPPLN